MRNPLNLRAQSPGVCAPAWLSGRACLLRAVFIGTLLNSAQTPPAKMYAYVFLVERKVPPSPPRGHDLHAIPDMSSGTPLPPQVYSSASRFVASLVSVCPHHWESRCSLSVHGLLWTWFLPSALSHAKVFLSSFLGNPVVGFRQRLMVLIEIQVGRGWWWRDSAHKKGATDAIVWND